MTRPLSPARAEARALLARLQGSTRRDRVAYVAGFVTAVRIAAPSLPTHELYRLRAIATALHEICGEDYR